MKKINTMFTCFWEWVLQADNIRLMGFYRANFWHVVQVIDPGTKGREGMTHTKTQRGHESHQNTERAWLTPKHREGMNHTKTQRGHDSHQNTERAWITPKHRDGKTHQNTERAWLTPKHREGMNHIKTKRGHESHWNREGMNHSKTLSFKKMLVLVSW